MIIKNLKSLGKKGSSTYYGLETFNAPENCVSVRCTSDEVTAVCPVTSQPDWYVVEIEYTPNRLCVESKSLKLYLMTFRNAGHFCEDLSQIIARDIGAAVRPKEVTVVVTQKSRGGISIRAESRVALGESVE